MSLCLTFLLHITKKSHCRPIQNLFSPNIIVVFFVFPKVILVIVEEVVMQAPENTIEQCGAPIGCRNTFLRLLSWGENKGFPQFFFRELYRVI